MSPGPAAPHDWYHQDAAAPTSVAPPSSLVAPAQPAANTDPDPTGFGQFWGSLWGSLAAAGLVADPNGSNMPGRTLNPVTPPWVDMSPTDPTTGKALPYNPLPQYWYTGADPSAGIADDRVYMGKEVTGDAATAHGARAHIGIDSMTGEESAGMQGVTSLHGSTTVQDAVNQPYGWDQKKILDVEKKMREAGLNVDTFDQMMSAWSGLVQHASKVFSLSAGKTAVTPWDMLEQTKQENIAAGKIDKSGNITRTSTHTSVMDVSEGDAWATMKSATAQLLGRDPTDQEIRDFASRASNVAANHPTTSTTTSTMNSATGNTTSSTDTSQGFDSNDLAHMAYVDGQNNPDYGAFQAASTYTNALMGALPEVAPGY